MHVKYLKIMVTTAALHQILIVFDCISTCTTITLHFKLQLFEYFSHNSDACSFIKPTTCQWLHCCCCIKLHACPASYQLQCWLIFSSFSTSEVMTLQWDIIVYIIIIIPIVITSTVVST